MADGSRGNYPPRKEYGEDELTELASIAGTDEPILAVADFSPGPWWGFNGVHTLVLTAERIHVVQRRVGGGVGGVRRLINLEAVQGVEWALQHRLYRTSVRMALTIDERPAVYTSKWANGLAFAEMTAARAAEA